MHLIQENTRGLGLLVSLNWDRVLFPAMIALCLTLAAYVASAHNINPFIL